MPATIDVKDAANTTVTVNTVDALVAITGATTDTPSTAVEDATSRTGVSLWKGIKNYLKSLDGKSAQQTLGTSLDVTGLAVTAAGTKVTAATIPTGGVGLLGWLSAIWYQLTQTIPVSGSIGGYTVTPSANFTRPADTTAYAVGDLVANSTTAGSVTPMSFTAARVAAGSGVVRRCRLKKSGTTITNGSFRLHLYGADPSASTGITNGDNGAWLTKQASYLGALDVTLDRVFSDASEGVGAPSVGSEIAFKLASGTTVYGLLEARAAYTPVSAEVFTAELELLQG